MASVDEFILNEAPPADNSKIGILLAKIAILRMASGFVGFDKVALLENSKKWNNFWGSVFTDDELEHFVNIAMGESPALMV